LFDVFIYELDLFHTYERKYVAFVFLILAQFTYLCFLLWALAWVLALVIFGVGSFWKGKELLKGKVWLKRG
jgi:fatty acid desaturase